MRTKIPLFSFNSLLRRRILIGFYGALLLLTTFWATVAIQAILSSHDGHTPDALASVGDVIGGATLILALIAGLVALQAFAAATGLPNLQVKVKFEFSLPNQPVFKAHNTESEWLEAESFKQTLCSIYLRNKSGYPARNPAVILRLQAMAFIANPHVDYSAWATVDFANTVGVTAVQWDGGPTYSIHGESTRRLPMLDLNKLWHIPAGGEPVIVVELFADGYRREVYVPVEFHVTDTEPWTVVGRCREAREWL